MKTFTIKVNELQLRIIRRAMDEAIENSARPTSEARLIREMLNNTKTPDVINDFTA